MIGHQALINLRDAGYRPQAVFVTVCEPWWCSVFSHPEMSMSLGGFPTVEISPHEVPGRLDLRFLAGLDVHLHADDEKGMLAVLERAMIFRPKTITAYAGTDQIYRYADGAMTILEVACTT